MALEMIAELVGDYTIYGHVGPQVDGKRTFSWYVVAGPGANPRLQFDAVPDAMAYALECGQGCDHDHHG